MIENFQYLIAQVMVPLAVIIGGAAIATLMLIMLVDLVINVFNP